MSDQTNSHLRSAEALGAAAIPLPDVPRNERLDVRRRSAATVNPTDLLIPNRVSGWALASCYFGLVAMLLPMLGFFFALVSLPCGLVALHRWRKATSYGNVTSNVRAILGVFMSLVGFLVWGALWVKILWLR